MITDDELDAIMVMSWEDGLAEIESFYADPMEQASVEGGTDAFHGGQVAYNQGKVEEVLPEVLTNTSGVRDAPPTNHMSGVVKNNDLEISSVTTTADQGVGDDEFATLMENIEQATADDVAQFNLIYQPHIILDHTSIPLGSGSNVDPATTEPHIGGSSILSGTDSEGTSQRLPKPVPVELSDQHFDRTQTQDAVHHPPQQGHEPAPAVGQQFERSLTLLSPRPNESRGTLPASTLDLPPQREPPYQPASITYTQEQRGLPLLLPRPQTLAPSPMPDISVAQSSPDMPSSEGKSSLFEEMRDKEEIMRSRLHERIPAPIFKAQPDIVPTVFGKGKEARTRPQEILKSAEIAQQNAEAVRVQIREDMPHVTGEAEVDQTHAGDLKSKETVIEAPKTTQGSNDSGVQVVVPRKRPPIAKIAAALTESSDSQPVPQRRSTRQQLPKQNYEESPEDAAAQNEDEAFPPTPVVPSKRKSGNMPPAANSKKRKVKSQTAKEVEPDKNMANKDNVGQDARPQKGNLGRSTMDKELKGIDYGILGAPLSPGPRKTRAQREEEVKKEPNAGRAAKARHAGTGR